MPCWCGADGAGGLILTEGFDLAGHFSDIAGRQERPWFWVAGHMVAASIGGCDDVQGAFRWTGNLLGRADTYVDCVPVVNHVCRGDANHAAVK